MFVENAQLKVKLAINDFYKSCDQVKAQNHWPNEVGCDFNSGKFMGPTPPAAKSDAPLLEKSDTDKKKPEVK